MKGLSLSRYAVSVCVAGTLFVGCAGPQAQSWNSASPLQSSAKPSSESLKQAAGGAFTASYAGKFKVKQGLFFTTHFHGTGSGTFSHRSTLRGTMICGFSADFAHFTFRSKKHPSDAFRVSDTQDICHKGKTQYTVTGGEGKFVNASGDGTLHLHLDNSNHTFTASWTGTLNF
jgi:hypothetical protein